MKELEHCPLCGAATLSRLKEQTFVLPEHLQSPATPASRNADEERLWIYFHQLRQQTTPTTVSVELCRNCGFIFTNPRLEQPDIETKYHWVGRLGTDEQRHRTTPPRVDRRGQRIFDLLDPLLRHQALTAPASILDYGGAEGYLLSPFLEQGYEANLVDYMNYPPASPAISYLGKDLADIPPTKRFDLILLLHTLEHVVDPVDLIRSLSERLTERGLLYIEVPLGAWLEWNSLREPITHINFFSEQSLWHAAREAGLETVVLNTQWQQVVHAHAMPCVNLVATKNLGPGTEAVTEVRSTQLQSRPWHQLAEGLRHNPRYYAKEALRGLKTLLT